MKKVLSMALAIVLTLCCTVGAYGEDDGSLLDLNGGFVDLLNSLDWSLSDWNDSGFSRATLTVFLALAIQVEVDGEVFPTSTTLLEEKSYVMKSDEYSLLVYLHGKESDIMAFYTPVFGKVQCAIIDTKVPDSVLKSTFEDISSDGSYEENNLSDISKAISIIADTIK